MMSLASPGEDLAVVADDGDDRFSGGSLRPSGVRFWRAEIEGSCASLEHSIQEALYIEGVGEVAHPTCGDEACARSPFRPRATTPCREEIGPAKRPAAHRRR